MQSAEFEIPEGDLGVSAARTEPRKLSGELSRPTYLRGSWFSALRARERAMNQSFGGATPFRVEDVFVDH
ncbi:hypothetical protein SBV1_3460011 [Verrucomicrobia bacterium]|nr:hypothetical protein SBV1_3460011 [Verrucomicrobiota bacterium]